MAFENVFRGIDFQAPVRADATRQAQFLNILGQGIAQAQDQARYNKRLEQADVDRGIQQQQREEDVDFRQQYLDLQKQEMSQPDAFDLKKAAQQAAFQYGTTGQLSQEGKAAIEAYQAFQQPQVNPLTGYVMQPADVMGNLGTGQPAPQGPVFPAMEQQGQQSSQVEGDVYTQSPVVKQKVAETAAVESAKRNVRGLERFNDGQLKAAGFAGRMVGSNKIFDDLEFSGPAASEARTGLLGGVSEALAILPLGDFGSGLGDAIVRVGGSPEQQRYMNAADNWVTANLRKESGAVIGAEEKADEYRKYFPVAGDSGAVIQQKEAMRKQVTKGMIGQSAGAFKEVFEEDSTPKGSTSWTEYFK